MILPLLVGLSLPASAASGLFDKSPPAANAFFLDLTGTTSGDTVDSRATCYAIQGLVNRGSAGVYLKSRGSDTEQLNSSGKPYTVLTLVGGSTSLRGVRTLFNKYHPSVQRMFVYEPTNDWTFYLAVMAGAQSNGIPVTDVIRSNLQAQVPGWSGDVVDFRNIGADRVEGYNWALTNLMPNCTRKSVFFARSFDLECIDWVVASKSFVFELSTSDAAQSNQISQIFATPGYGPGTSLGGYAGDSVNRLANPYGIGYNVSDFYSNGSFWPSFPNKTYTQRAGQAVNAQNGKVYVAILLSDGDNLQFDQGDIYIIWKNDPARGTVPVGTSLSPILQEINTPLLDWYYTNKTANDELMAGPCGVQFIYLDDYDPALLPQWCEINARWTADAGFSTASVWLGTYPSASYDVYTAMSGVDNIRHNANLFSLSSNPQLTNGVLVFNERIRDCTNATMLYEDLAGVATNASAPRFATGKLITPRFGGTNFSAVKSVIDQLNANFPGKYVFQLPMDQAATAREYFQPNRTWNTGNGTWDTSTANWLNSASNSATFANNVHAVVFGDAAGVTNNPVITLNSSFTPRHVKVQSTNRNYTLSGAGAGGIGGNTALILDPANTMTLTLQCSNSYTGDTTVNGGTLALGTGGRLGSGGNYGGELRIAGGAAVNIQTSSSQTFSGPITGAGTLRLNGGSDLLLTGSAGNTINNVFITGGRVFVNNANAITASTATTITNNGILNIGNNPTTIGPITIQNNGGIATRAAAGTTLANVTLPSPGTVIFNNDDSTTRSLTITSGQTLAGNLTVQIGGSRTTANAVGGVTLSGILSGSGGLIVRANTNTLTLSGANTYFGDTTISNGILALSGGGSISNTANLIIGSGATLDVSAPTTPLTLSSAQTLKASATGANTNGTIRVASGKNLSLGNATVGLEFTAFGGGATAPLTLSGTAGNLVLNGRPIKVTTTSVLNGGPYKLIATNGAGATVSGTPGTLIVGGSGLGGIGSLSVSNGQLFLTLAAPATYYITNATTDVNGTCTPTGVTSVAGGGIQTYIITPNTDYAVGTLTVNGAPVPPALSYTFSNVSTNHTIAATFVPATTLYWDSDSTTAGFGSTTGTWGTSQFWSLDASGSSSPLAITTTTNSSVNFGSATLNYNNPAVTVAAGGVNVGNITFGAGQSTALTIAGGNITLRDTAAITVNNASNTIGSLLTGAGTSLTKAGTGLLTLTATNSYTGNTIISTGTLQLGASNVIPDGSGKGNVAVTGTLDLNTFSDTINGLSGAGTVDTVAGGTPTLTVGGNDATSTFSGVITDTAGTMSLNKIGGGTLTLAGLNTYIGGTTISNGILALNGAATLGGPASALTLSGGQVNLGGLTRTNGTVSITAAAASGPTITNGTLSGASFTASNTNGNAIVSAILTGSGSFTKSGSGTVILSGANSFSGATTISDGILQLGANNSLPTGTALTIGTGSSVGTLDLATFSQTVAGLVVASTSDTASTNSLVIGAGKTLTVTGGFTNGINTGANAITKLNVTGAGTFNVTGGTFQIGGSTTTGAGNPGTVDLSGLTSFIYNNSVGTLRVGDVGGSSGGGPGFTTLILAATNTITAATVATSDSQSAAMTNYIKLGSGANIINANAVSIGMVGNRIQGGSLDFNTGTGTLRIRNTAGTGRANMTVGYGNASTSVSSLFNNVDLTGHSSDLLLGNLQIAGRTGGTGGGTGTFSFDTGTLDTTTITVGLRSGTTSANAVIGTLNLGGGAVTNGSLVLATSTSTSGGAVLATNNITGGAVFVTNAATSITLGSASSASAGGGTAVLHLTGGSLMVAGNIVKGATNGVVNSLLNLSGGALDLGGKNIGNAGSNVTFNAESGALRNVATINGTGGLTKTTAGTLVLSGVNGYSGDTTISAGTLKLGAANAIPDGTGKGSVAVSGTLDLNGFSDTINGLSGGGKVDNTVAGTPTFTAGGNNQSSTFSGVITNSAGTLSLVKTGSGVLTLSGTNGYTGNTTVNAGTLVILNPTIATSSTVLVTNGAFLQLNFAVTNRVAALVLNGVNKAPGVYNNVSGAPFLTGAGSLQVAAPGPSSPAMLTNSVSGGVLSLSWPANQGWRLQCQTNPPTLGLSTNWVEAANSSVSSTNITIDSTLGSVFYRLVYP